MNKLYVIELPSGLEYINTFLSVYGIYNLPVTIEMKRTLKVHNSHAALMIMIIWHRLS